MKKRRAVEIGLAVLPPVPSPRWVMLDCCCPACRRPPRLRIVDSVVSRYVDLPPSQIVAEITCGWEARSGPACRVRYPVTAGAFQRAS